MTTAFDLLTAIDSHLDSLANGQFRGRALDSIHDAAVRARDLRSALEQVGDFADLTIGGSAAQLEQRMSTALSAWNAIVSEINETDVDALRIASPTLSDLHGEGIDFRSVYRFSERQIHISELLGDGLQDFPEYYFSLLRQTKFPTFSLKVEAVDKVRDVVAKLVRAGATESAGVEAQLKHGKWIALSDLRSRGAASAFRVRRGIINREHIALLNGDWLTAYAYFVASDQLSRRQVPHEIYSKVAYALPGDLGGGAGDVDVLVRTANMLISIECKSGQTLVKHNGESALSSTVKNAERFDKLLDRMGSNLERYYFMLHSPAQTSDADEVSQRAKEASARSAVDVVAITPAELRPTVKTFVERATGKA